MTTPPAPGLDTTWADEARRVRQAVELLGWPLLPHCLPDEPDACGGGFAQHAASYYLVLCVIADHQLHQHICMPHDQQERIYADAHDSLLADCEHAGPDSSACCPDFSGGPFSAWLQDYYPNPAARQWIDAGEADLEAAFNAGRASAPWQPAG